MADVQRTKKSTMGVCGREFRGEKFKETVSVALKAEMPLEGHVRLCQGIGGDELTFLAFAYLGNYFSFNSNNLAG